MFHVNLLQIHSAVPEITAENPVLSVVTLTFDLDIQTHLSEGPNTSSL